MALNIKNTEVERLASEVSILSRVSKTEAIKVALEERLQNLKRQQGERAKSTLEWLKADVWPRVPSEARNRLTREQEDQLLGFGRDGI